MSSPVPIVKGPVGIVLGPEWSSLAAFASCLCTTKDLITPAAMAHAPRQRCAEPNNACALAKWLQLALPQYRSTVSAVQHRASLILVV